MMNTRNHPARYRAALPFALALVGMIGLTGCITTKPGSSPGAGAPQPQRTVQQQRFGDPQVEGRWLDICFGHGSCREQQAVDTFCRQHGFQRAISRQSRVALFGHQTVRIGDRSRCNSLVGNCHRVISVVCQRIV